MQTQPNPDDGTRRVLVVVDREFPGDQHGDARRVAEAVDGSDVLVVRRLDRSRASAGSST